MFESCYIIYVLSLGIYENREVLMPFIENVKDVFGGLGSCDLSVDKIPAFRAERRCVDISRVVIAIVGAIFSIAILVLGVTALNLCCPTSALAGGCAIVSGILLLSWVVVMILRLCGVGKITKEPLVRVAGIEEGDRADRVVTDMRAAEVCS
ncbi:MULTISPECIES: hypothetical protein [Chlamydia]|uniref:hypothetical protein n=1 Tax=Chlamydia TaxID=810 RepID=UPI000206D86C|nr:MULTISPECIES: hypothetical protein [Chlamydia]AFS22861.1 putative transmembrane protein [Chlamydia psittaci VS225]AEB55633.1 conserved hypothetical protein [Chlamydia psittaci 6BC]ATQ71651.1 uncharacterized protein CHPS25_0632 [Chlamydia psittaci]ATQ72678.1 uncharacterized protein CHPS23_0634 [Chlamydia psittaci]ATQ79921.1 uncharacterized protein CHPS1_0634 [Chlamydia psittaci]